MSRLSEKNVTKPTKAKGAKRGEARQLVLEEALMQFSSIGFEGVSTRRLAEACNVNHSLITYHFGNKLGLWQAVMTEVFQTYRERVSARLEGLDGLEPDVALKIGFRDFATLCSQRPEIHRIMTIEGRRRTERLEWLVEHHLKDFYDSSKALILEGQKRGTVKSGEPGRLYYAVIALAGTAFAFAPEIELVTGKQASPEQDIEATMTLINRIIFAD